MVTPERCCRTCCFFEPAPLAGKGWCRNPVLYAPQHQHLVEAAELDCQRPFGDFWQGRASSAETPMLAEATTAPMPSLQTATAPAIWYTARRPTGRRDLTLRLLVAGVPLLLLVSLGIWLSRSWDQVPLQAMVSEAPIATSQPTSTNATPAIALAPAVSPTPRLQTVMEPTATPSPPSPTAIPATNPPAPTATIAPPTATPQPTAQPAPEPTVAPTEPPAEEPVVASAPQTIEIGANGVVATGDPKLRLRIRRSPDINSTIIGRISDGHTLTVIDGPRQADGQVWWKIQYQGMVGWVAGAFIYPGA